MKIESYPLNLYKTQADQKKLRSACVEFEAIFISKLLEGLRKTIDKSGFIDGGQGEEIFTDMLYDEYAKAIAQNGSLGLAEMMYRDIVKVYV
ncbi:MAG: rod-binding protein [bacterium]